MSELPFDINTLLSEKKEFIQQNAVFPVQGTILPLNGVGMSTRIDYIVDINRKYYSLKRITFHQRVFTNISLLRLDLVDSKPHRNPDGTKISGTHLHVYREGFGDTWAYELDDPALNSLFPGFDFTSFKPDDHLARFNAFSNLCNFTNRISFVVPLSI